MSKKPQDPSSSSSYFSSLLSTQTLSDLHQSLHHPVLRPQLTRRAAFLTSPPSSPPPPPPPPPPAAVATDSREKCVDDEVLKILKRPKDPSNLLALLIRLTIPETRESSGRTMNLLVRYYPDELLKTLVILFEPLEIHKNYTKEIPFEIYGMFLDIMNRILPHASNSRPEDVPDGSWDIMVLTLGKWLQSSKEKLQELAISLIGKLLRWGAHDWLRRKDFDASLSNILKEKLTSREVALPVKENAVKTCFACILYLSYDGNYHNFQDLLQKVMNTVFRNGRINFDMSQVEYAHVVIQGLNEVAKVNTEFLLQQIDEVLEFIVSVIEGSEFDEATIYLARKFLSALEKQKRPPGCPSVGISYVKPKILKISETLEGNNIDRDGNEQEYVIAMKEFGKLVTNMGGLVLESLHPPHFSWKRSPSAVTLFCNVAKMGTKKLKPKLYLLVVPLMHFVKDIDPHVRRMAIIAIQDMSKQLQPQFQTQFHGMVVPALTEIITSDFLHPQIQVEAVRALSYLAETCRSDIFALHLDKVVSTLLECLQREGSVVQKSVLEAIQLISISVQQHYTRQHYDQLLAALIECIMSNLCMDEIVTDKVIKLLVSVILREYDPKPDDLRNKVLLAWCRLCEYLGQEFKPYLLDAVPHLLSFIGLDHDMAFPNDSDYEETPESYQKKVRSKVLDEKTTACVVLTIFADMFKKDFAPWVPEVVEVFSPLINFPDEAGIAAVTAMPVLLRSYREANGHQNFQYQELVSAFMRATEKVEEERILPSEETSPTE